MELVLVHDRVQDSSERHAVARVGPFTTEPLRVELAREAGGDVTLRRVLDTVVDRYELDADGWLELRKDVELQEGVA